VTDHPQVQRRCFYDCVVAHGHRATWMALLDSDEFFEAAAPTEWAANATAFAHTPFLRPSLRRLQGATPLVPVRWSTALTSGRLLPPPPGGGHTLASYHPTTCAVRGNPRELADWKRYVWAPTRRGAGGVAAGPWPAAAGVVRRAHDRGGGGARD